MHDETVKVYNFKVEDYHTYFVGDSSLLVHNAEYSPTKPRYGERRISDEEYDELRSQTPSRKVRQKVNENNIIGADDPAIHGKKIEAHSFSMSLNYLYTKFISGRSDN